MPKSYRRDAVRLRLEGRYELGGRFAQALHALRQVRGEVELQRRSGKAQVDVDSSELGHRQRDLGSPRRWHFGASASAVVRDRHRRGLARPQLALPGELARFERLQLGAQKIDA